MAVDTTSLRNELEQHSNVLFCGVNNEKSYVVALEDVTATKEEIETIITGYTGVDYPNTVASTLAGGVYKTERFV